MRKNFGVESPKELSFVEEVETWPEKGKFPS